MANYDRDFLPYTVLDKDYQNGALNFVPRNNEAGGILGTIKNPDASRVPIAASLYDPVVYPYVKDSEHRILLGKISSTKVPAHSDCTYTVVKPTQTAPWEVKAENIVLTWPTTNLGDRVAGNPYGVAQIGDYLYLVDFESTYIYVLKADELDGLTAGSTHALTNAPINLGTGTLANLPATAHGVAIIALDNILYALYIDVDDPFATTPNYQPSHLLKLNVSGATLNSVVKVDVGLNAQSIVPITNDEEYTYLLVPSIGGKQNYGESNGVLSDVYRVRTDVFTQGNAVQILTGVAGGGTPAYYDFRGIAATARAGNNGLVYFLTGIFNETETGFDWILYRSTVGQLAGMSITLDIAGALATDPPIFTKVDGNTYTLGYFWDILYHDGATTNDDILAFLAGSPILITRAADYSSPYTTPSVPAKYHYFTRGALANPLNGNIGGDNVNSAALVDALLAAPAEEQKMSLKRHLRGTPPKPRALLGKAKAKGTRAAAAEEEVEEEEQK
jgi:hypothetical protein